MSLEIPVLLLSCGAAGVVDAIGGGGGMLTLPAFIGAGVPLGLLLGTNKATSCMGSMAALYRYSRAGLMPRISVSRWILFVTISLTGAVAGAAISQSHWVLDHLKVGIPVLLFLVMAFLCWRWFGPGQKNKSEESTEVNLNAVTSVGVGAISAYDGLFGPGTGTFFLSFLETRGLPTLRANALSKVFNVGSNLGALIWFASRGSVMWRLGAIGAVTYLAGNFVGSGLVLSQGQKVVRFTTLFMTGLLLIRTIWVLSS